MFAVHILCKRPGALFNPGITSKTLSFIARWASPSLKPHSIPIPRLSGNYQTIRQSTSLFFKEANQILLTNVKSGRIFAFSIGSACLLSRLCTRAHCKTKPSRVVEVDEINPDLTFDWRGFFWMVWPDIWSLIGAITSAVVVALVNIQIPLMIGELVNVISSFTQQNAGDFFELVATPAKKLCLFYFIQGLSTMTYISLLSSLGENVSSRLRKTLFQSLISQDIEFFDKNKTGELIDRLTSDVQDFKSSFKACVAQGLKSFTQAAGCVGALFSISPKLTGLLLGVVPTLICVGSFLGSFLRKLSRQVQAQLSRSTAIADEAIGNIRTVRAFSMEKKEVELYGNEVDKSRQMTSKLGLGIAVFQGLSNIALNGVILGVLFTGGYMMSCKQLTPGDLMSFLVATQTIERSLAHMSLLFGQAVRGMSAGARVFEFINTNPSIPLTGGDKLSMDSLQGEVCFNHVNFAYPTRKEQQVLSDFSLKIPHGKMLALVGPSGGGKSTVVKLLERFYDVSSGEILIDGHNLQSLDPSWLRGKAIGFINQEPVLFATSVMENIRYGNPDATDDEVLDAAKLANADSFIRDFPDGYNTILGERGVTVSGGQKQRIAIARALVKNPSILILDEATSALDTESEKIVQEALDRVCNGRTVIVIAHRLSTIKNADMVAVISKGKIVELGNHNSLLDKRGLFYKLIQQQNLMENIHRSSEKA